ncbi:hypothetical protein, partial [Fischerella thermalis]|uniref:hypothetical protein n=1 Tax=Fischerella thermalis TaxID=372787 RepID=UPI001CA5EA29
GNTTHDVLSDRLACDYRLQLATKRLQQLQTRFSSPRNCLSTTQTATIDSLDNSSLRVSWVRMIDNQYLKVDFIHVF